MKVKKILKRKLLKALGTRLKSLRTERGITQEALAFDSGIERNYYCMIEKGQRSPSIYCLYMIARELGVTLKEIAEFKVD